MAKNVRTLRCTPADVFEVLENGWLYPAWVVGASRMRDVDEGWPAVGTRLHHSVGSWPLLIDDTTEVLEADPPSRLLLLARGWPAGEAHVEFVLEQTGSETLVTIHEDAPPGVEEHVGRDQSVGPRPDDDRVVVATRRRGHVVRPSTT